MEEVHLIRGGLIGYLDILWYYCDINKMSQYKVGNKSILFILESRNFFSPMYSLGFHSS